MNGDAEAADLPASHTCGTASVMMVALMQSGACSLCFLCCLCYIVQEIISVITKRVSMNSWRNASLSLAN